MILAYHIREDVIKELGLPYKIIGDEHLQMRMMDIVHQTVKGTYWTYAPFLYLYDVGKDEMKKVDSLSIGRVAMSTETNLNWKLETLLQEVEKEYHYFQVRNTLYEYLIHPNKDRIQSDSNYLKKMSYAFSLYENEKTPVEILEQVLQDIRNSL